MKSTPRQLANQRANLKPFEAGDGWRGNAKGGRRLGATVKDWWNALGREDDDGVPKYTMAEIKNIADAPDGDAKVSPAKRIAARHVIEMAAGGRTGREVSAMLFDRTEGRPSQHISVDSGPELKRIVLVDQAAPALSENGDA